jgi:hypothetical protein
MLVTKLDKLLNGEHAIENQIKLIEKKKSQEKLRKRNKLNQLKEEWKQRENNT